MQTALTMNGSGIHVAPGFRDRVWLLLLEYFDYLQIPDDPMNQEQID